MRSEIKVMLLIITSFLLYGAGKDNDFHDDLIKIYIEKNVTVNESGLTTSDPMLNEVLMKGGASRISKWLPRSIETNSYDNIFLNRYYMVELSKPNNQMEELVIQFSNLKNIRSVERVPIIKINDAPNDFYWQQLYGLRQTYADSAYTLWDYQNGEIPGSVPDDEVVVGIVDLGLMWDHPDLIENIWRNLGEDADGDGNVIEFIDGEWVFDPGDTNSIDDDGDGYIDNFLGYDIAFGDNDPMPSNLSMAHGTMVAGCVSGMTNNEIGIASIGWSVKLMGVNSGQNSTNISHGYEGILAAAQMGADIINLSWGMSSWFESHQILLNFIDIEYDCILVAAAGNYGVNEAHYPASYESVISVTATGSGNQFNCWPNFHETVDISAPGDNIWTTIPFSSTDQDMYDAVTGTSFSSPTVAGALALLKSVFPYSDSEMLISRILNSTTFFDDMEGECNGQSLEGLLGEGQLNIYDALIMDPFIEIAPTDINVISQGGLAVPGDTNEISISLLNLSGSAPMENAIVQLSTNYPSINIIDNEAIYEGVIPSGHDFEVNFLIASDEMTSFGEIPFSLNVSASVSGNIPTGLEFDPYVGDLDIMIPFGFAQDGYPINDVTVDAAPLFTDLYGNSSFPQIFFNSDSMVMGNWISGFDVLGFPFDAGSRVTTSITSGDVDGDADGELIFGTEDGSLYVLNKDGSVYLEFTQPDPIIGFPVLYDINGSEELNMIFISINDSSSNLHVISNEGDYIEGFPIALEGELKYGSSVSDLDRDGVPDIVTPSEEGTLNVIESSGELMPGFPIHLSSNITTPATIADMDGDDDLEVMVGTIDGHVHILNHDGSIMQTYYTDAAICSGLSIADLDQDGFMEMVFNTSDHLLHAWEPHSQMELEGWPVDMGNESVTEPMIIDLNNDLNLEVISIAKDGFMNVIQYDGSSYDNFPYLSYDSTQFSPAIGDLDEDNDYEIIVGTNNNLKVLDILDELGDQYSWNAYRGNTHRSGFYDSDLSYLRLVDDEIPFEFRLGNNYPNPFNPSTKIIFTIPENMQISVNVYDIMGRRVRTLVDGLHRPGNHYAEWSGVDQSGIKVSSGIYFYELRGEGLVETRKMLLIK